MNMASHGGNDPKGILKAKGNEEAVKAIQASKEVQLPSTKTLQRALNDAEANKARNRNLKEERAAAQKVEASKKPRRSLRWDEANLLMNEEEKVPRMKIDEPPTPFYKSVDEDFDDLDELELDPTAVMERANRRASSSSVDFDRQPGLKLGEHAPDELASEAVGRRADSPHHPRMRAWDDPANAQHSDGEKMTDDEAPDETPEERETRQKFREKRKAHYNEFEAMLAMRAKMQQEDDDDEDDEDDDGGDESNVRAESTGTPAPTPAHTPAQSLDLSNLVK